MEHPLRRIAGAAVATVLVGMVGPLATPPAGAAQIEGVYRCSDRDPNLVEIKLDRAPVVGDVITDGTVTITITAVTYKADGSGEVVGFDFESDSPVSLIVKGGKYSKTYYFNAPTTGGTGWTATKANGTHYEVSFAAFCYNPNGGPA